MPSLSRVQALFGLDPGSWNLVLGFLALGSWHLGTQLLALGSWPLVSFLGVVSFVGVMLLLGSWAPSWE